MRRTKTITLPGARSEKLGERDNGKTYLLTEMSAADAEAWALNALTLIGQAGVNLPDGVASYGMAGLAIIGLDSLMKVDFQRALPLLKDIMNCVQFIPDPAKPFPRAIDELGGTDIEEVRTRLLLRDAVFELHTGFCAADLISRTLASAANLNLQYNAKTSPPQSPQS